MAKKREHRFASCRQLIEALHCGEESSVTLEPVDEADQASVVALELVGPPPLRPESVPDSAVCRSSLPKWLEEAGKGDRVAQYRVGTCYYNGWGVPADRDEAVRWFKMAAAEGHAEAQYRLANAYAAGEGAPLDRFEAARWYHRAAEQGHSEAQYHLGICYEMGNGVAANALEAAKWYYRAAQQGNRAARQRYGRLPWWATIVQGPWMDMLK